LCEVEIQLCPPKPIKKRREKIERENGFALKVAKAPCKYFDKYLQGAFVCLNYLSKTSTSALQVRAQVPTVPVLAGALFFTLPLRNAI
jgi:hypothetical protein